MNKYFPSNSKLKEQITAFKNRDSKESTIENIKSAFGSLIAHIPFISFRSPKSIKLHRIRINIEDQDFTSVKDLWCPPVEHVSKLGRCNDIGDQILYLSGGGHTALQELKPAPGSLVTCIEFEVIEDIQLIDLGVLKNIQREKYLQQYRTIHENLTRKYYGDNINKFKLDKILRDFIIDEFTRKVHQDELHLYKKSIAISKHFLSAPDIQGIMYPSIKTGLKEINYAFSANTINKYLEPKRVDVIKILPAEGNIDFPFMLLKGSYNNLDYENNFEYVKPQGIVGWANPRD